MFVVFDLDGTLCDISHRLHHIQREPKDWGGFFATCVNDEPKWPIIQTLLTFTLSDVCGVEIWSGRSDQVYLQTVGWLQHHGVPGGLLTRMRPAGDRRPDVELKRGWLHECRVRPDLVFDDRQRLVDMWRTEGITCCQVEAWEE